MCHPAPRAILHRPRTQARANPLSSHSHINTPFSFRYVGKLIKQAKRRVTWKFCFEGDTDDHSVSIALGEAPTLSCCGWDNPDRTQQPPSPCYSIFPAPHLTLPYPPTSPLNPPGRAGPHPELWKEGGVLKRGGDLE